MSRYNLILTAPAKADIRQTMRYISEELHNPTAANRLNDNITAAIQKLGDGSGGHRLVDDDYLAAKGVRRLIVRNYLVFFIVKEDAQSIYILRILYGRRDWAHLLKENFAIDPTNA
ncbi:MAG: type II toxin-antitoxin system RelE/ParE family toxin [Oscillospiraceae bacterium]|jgi:toxin ParE1/3/4|nr:type II toxin-antitoxin system RelE/ParE family toxin [Oscillospiraceae bacterium]